MKTINLLLIIFLLTTINVFAQQENEIKDTGESVTLKTKSGNIEGTLLIPDDLTDIPVALIIAGSGPTDRDGNNPMMKNNSLKMLAEKLFENGIASLRYDKRGIAASRESGLDENELRFENYIDDAVEWIELLKQKKQFKKIVIIGHSEGSLIGMIASKKADVDIFISIAGVGQSADKTLKEQLKSQPQVVIDAAYPIIDSLVQGKIVENFDPMLSSLFRLSVQPYIISWFRYDPQTEIEKLKLPILIVQGTTDIQVSVDDANKLADANNNAKLEIIEGMNHIFKEAESDRQKNIATYSQPDLPVKVELIEVIVSFIKNTK
ncbi:MAG: alpha/beta hydrolase [Bacteroidales bacterium]|nr:alpha/beta hydrolase [Bacteroidales bacterium]